MKKSVQQAFKRTEGEGRQRGVDIEFGSFPVMEEKIAVGSSGHGGGAIRTQAFTVLLW
ncbi:uncharacterized protein G2W53_043042 [Senna tora]|uniref:Uncharacterized protein n=1 Tax=Senna tora TaxID=362788 RepID=A0A834W308_9FABA|nr:uncharacterized protein G2W53_043042 [Senna tora]